MNDNGLSVARSLFCVVSHESVVFILLYLILSEGTQSRKSLPSIAWNREAKKDETLDDLPSKDEKGSSSIRPR